METILTLLGGALAGGVASWVVGEWQRRRSLSDRMADAQFELVRRLARYKGGPELAYALNEVPLLFGSDGRAVELYRHSRPSPGGSADMEQVGELILYLARAVGLPSDVSPDDFVSGFIA